MTKPFTILGISGSLRRDSYNTALLRAARELLPEGVRLETFDKLREIPLFDQDLEAALPPAVAELKERILEADAVLIATPEYNYSVPGVLKNAIDWASRPYGTSAWKGKVVAVMGASVGALGTARAQYHLRQSFVFLDMPAVNQPEVMLARAAEKFDATGALADETAKRLLRQLLGALVALARKHRAPVGASMPIAV